MRHKHIDNARCGLQSACNAPGAATAGHARDGECVNRLAHGLDMEPIIFNLSKAMGAPKSSPQALLVTERVLEFHSRMGFHPRNRRELPMTLTDESDIAAAANAGGSNHPVDVSKKPMASGIPIRL